MAYAVLMLLRGVRVKVRYSHSTASDHCRQTSIEGVDGSQTYASVFFHQIGGFIR